MKTVTGACDICKREFTNNNPQDLARAIGTHKRLAHNQLPTGKYLKKDKALVRYYQKLGKEPKSDRAKQAFKRAEAAQHPVVAQFMPAMHDRCPKCGARFWAWRTSP